MVKEFLSSDIKNFEFSIDAKTNNSLFLLVSGSNFSLLWQLVFVI